MKHIKSYENIDPVFGEYKMNHYIIWNDKNDWEICQIVDRYDYSDNALRVKDLFYLENGELKESPIKVSDIMISIKSERDAIRYISSNLEDCKKQLFILIDSDKYNL